MSSTDSTPTPRGTPLISATSLEKRYGGQSALSVERIELRKGELLAVLGPNGAGKSTLLRLLSMLERPTTGTVAFEGRSGAKGESALRAASAVVFQRPHFWRESVAYNVGLGLKFRGVPRAEAARRVAATCAELGIGDLLLKPVMSLSGGEAQRVALARALVVEPRILFLDEPTANLDSAARMDLRTDLEGVVRKRTSSVLLNTHDRNEAFYLADRVAVLSRGRLVQVGTPTDLYEDPADPYVARMTGAELTVRGRVTEVSGRKLTVDVEGVALAAVGRVEVGTDVKVAYRPEDLILTPAGAPIDASSTRNLLHATIRDRKDLGGLVRLRLAGPPELVALVTRSAAEELDLDKGAGVVVRAKATALHAYPSAAASGPDDDGAASPHGAAELGGQL